MSEPGKAVFLSYASQDAEAARRICATLRAEGVEVWLDADGGLEHGDEWDAKIRRQIKECVLFIPLISAATQARHEGYFRIEWELAAQRALGIASGVPFILPVVIDDTREPEALVPDRFRMVQWTHLPRGAADERFAARIGAMLSRKLGGEAVRISSSPIPRSPDETLTPSAARKWIPVATALILLAVGGWYWSQIGNRKSEIVNAAATAPVSEARKLARQARALLLTTEIGISELTTAGLLAEKAIGLDKSDAEVWATASEVETAKIHYLNENTSERRDSARTKAATALRLDRNSFEARRARAYFLVLEGDRLADRSALAEAEPIVRTLHREQPRDAWTLLVLGRLLAVAGRIEESASRIQESADIFDEMATIPGREATALSEKAYVLNTGRRWAEADRALDQSIAVEPFTGNINLKITYALHWRGDRDLAQATLEKLSPSMLLDDRGVFAAIRVYRWRREPEKLLALLNRFPRDWIEGLSPVPKARITGDARALLGQATAAQNDWRQALSLVEARLAGRNDASLLRQKAFLLDALGDPPAASAVQDLLGELTEQLGELTEQAQLRGSIISGIASTVDRLVGAPVLLDRIEAGVRQPNLGYSPASLRLNPIFDKVRDDPRFQAALAYAEANGPKPAAMAKSIAVLSFTNLSDDKANDWLADGITDELSAVLGTVPGLKVVGRTSVLAFKGTRPPLAEIARQLNVTYLVDGTVQPGSNIVRISASLIRVSDGEQLWIERFDRDPTNVLALQEEIAALIAPKLALKVNPAPAAKPVNPEALSLYVQGRQAWSLRTKEGFDRAEALFNWALEVEPNFARVHAGLADVLLLRGSQIDFAIGTPGQRNAAAFVPILSRIDQALALDPNSAEAHTSRGLAYATQWRLADAEREYRLAISLNPSYATAHQVLARALGAAGKLDEALIEIKLASELDPLSGRIMSNYGLLLLSAGRTMDAMAEFDRAITLNPGEVQAYCWKAIVLAGNGKVDEALKLMPLITGDSVWANAVVLAAANRMDEAARILAAEQRPFERSLILLAMGRRQEALKALVPEAWHRDYRDIVLFEPAFDPIRTEPEFQQFIAALGLTEANTRAQAWRAAHPPQALK